MFIQPHYLQAWSSYPLNSWWCIAIERQPVNDIYCKLSMTLAPLHNLTHILNESERYFEIYQAHSLLFFGSEISWFVSVSTAKLYLAINKNKQLLIILTDEVLYKCKEVHFTVCPAGQVIYKWRPQHCLVVLYHRKVMLQEKYVELKFLIQTWPSMDSIMSYMFGSILLVSP